MTIYFTADQHFQHKNIIRWCNRPFKSVKEMNHNITERHNSVVKSHDTVYHLGDFCMTANAEYIAATLNKLKGTHHLILGNHDSLKPFTYVNAGFMRVHTTFPMRINGNIFELAHDPAIYTVLRDEVLLCGHIHTLFKYIPDKPVINVGVDVNDYTPVSLDYIMYFINKHYNL